MHLHFRMLHLGLRKYDKNTTGWWHCFMSFQLLDDIVQSDSAYCDTCYRSVVSICPSVCMSSVTLVHPAKAVGRNEMPFGGHSRVVPTPKYHCVRRSNEEQVLLLPSRWSDSDFWQRRCLVCSQHQLQQYRWLSTEQTNQYLAEFSQAVKGFPLVQWSSSGTSNCLFTINLLMLP